MNNRSTSFSAAPSSNHNTKEQAEEIAIEPIATTSLDGQFPCFVRHGEVIEDPASVNTEAAKYAIIARNGLRHLTYGIPFVDCKLVTWDNFSALFISRNPLLLSSLRTEIQHIFQNIDACLHSYDLDIPTQHRLEIFISNLLTAYPFLDPEDGEQITMPHPIANTWHMVNYQFEKIDISPKTGLLSRLLEEEDRLYAYGLSPLSHHDAQPILLFMGTSYPSGQGADLNWLYNFAPNHSVGEKHHSADVAEWIARHHNIKAIGHSKGGTMAMIYAANYPDAVRQADCLSPTALSSATLRRLRAAWETLETPPKINVYAHRHDPVYYIDRNFLPNTTIYRFGEKQDDVHPLAAHAHYFAGRKNTVIRQYQHVESDMRSWRRDFLTDVKSSFNWVMFPLMYSKLVYKLCARKVRRFCENHTLAIHSFLFVGSLIALVALATTGVLAPVTAPLAATVSPMIFNTCLSLAIILGAGLTTALLPKTLDIAERGITTTAFTGTTAIALLSCFSLSGIYSLLKSSVTYVAQTFGHEGSAPKETSRDGANTSARHLSQPGSTLSILKHGSMPPSPQPKHAALRRSMSLPNLVEVDDIVLEDTAHVSHTVAQRADEMMVTETHIRCQPK